MSSTSSTSSPLDIPVYRIDLGLPPKDRYVQVASDFAERMRAVIPLYEEILSLLLIYRPLIFITKLFVRLFLRSVWDHEQTLEIRSIAEHARIDLSLVVVLNTLLDILLGCTSGAMTVRDKRSLHSPAHLLHFRTLDWGMPALRDLLIALEFVDSTSANPDQVLARSVTYAGFVGCLTGARPGLSLSLNHRPLQNGKTKALAWHQLRILLGKDESISSRLRRVLLSPELPPELTDGQSADSPLEAFSESFSKLPSSPCYLIFCTPREATVIQKDHLGGRIKSSQDFIVQTNHDTDHTKCCGATEFYHAVGERDETLSGQVLGAETWIEESTERQEVMKIRWAAHCSSRRDRSTDHDDSVCNGVCTKSETESRPVGSGNVPGVSRQLLEQWLSEYPVVNECTHFITIMDPLKGDIIYLKRGPDNVSDEDTEEE